MAEEVIYEQVGQGDPDPLGLRKKAAAKQPAKADPLGLRKQLPAQPAQPQQPEFQIKLSEPSFGVGATPVLNQAGTVVQDSGLPARSKEFTFEKPVDVLAIDKLKGKAAVSHGKLKNELLGNDAQYEKNVREHRRDSYTIENLREDYKKQGMILSPQDEQKLLQKEKQKRYDLPVVPEEISDIKTGTILNEGATRKFIKNMKRPEVLEDLYTVDKYNELANDPNAQYRVEKIKDIAKKIGKGALLYDPETRRAIQPLGLIGSIVEGTKNKFKADEEHDFFKNAPDATIINELESERNNPDTDEPLKVPKGKAQEVLMSLSEMPLSPIAAGAIGSLAGPQAGLAAGAAVGAYENRKAQYRAAFKQVYNELRDQGASEFESLQAARKQAEQAQEIGTIVGLGQGYMGAKIGATPLKAASFSPSYQKAIGAFLKQNGNELGKMALEGAAQGGIGVAGEMWKNKLAQTIGIKRDIDEGTADQFWGNLFMTVGIGAAMKAGRGMTKSNYKTVLHGISKIPEPEINGVLQEKVNAGEVTQEAADQTLQRINEYKEKDAQIPPNVTEDARFKIQDNIDKLNELESQKEATHKSLQEPIKENITKLEEANLALLKETDKPVKSESGLSRAKEKEAIETAEEFVAEGILPDVYNEMVKKDPVGFWKMVAQQAQNRDENWHPLSEAIDEQAVRDQFGDTVVEYAKELFPAPELPTVAEQLAEPVSVKPDENVIANEAEAASEEEQGMGAELPSTEVGQRPIEETGATPSQEWQAGAPPIAPTEESIIHAEHPGTQLSFRGLQDTANEFGFEDVKSRDRVSDLQERKNAEVTVNEWASNGEYQKNVDDLLERIEKREHVPTAKQRLILEQYLANEKQKARDLPKDSREYDTQLRKVERLKEIGQIARQEAGAALRLPDSGTLPHPILDETDAMIAKKQANAVDDLTDQQKAEVLKQVEDYKKASDEASAKVAQLEEQVAQLEAAKEVKKVVSTTKRTKKTTEERQAYRKSEIEAAREALRKLRSGESGLSAVPLPGVRELMAIAPHVKNIMVDLAEQGITELGEIVKRIHGDFKDVLDGITEKDIHNIIAGEFNEKRKPLSVLQQQIKDLQDEAKYINQLEGLMRGMEPKGEKAKIERNQKIKELKGKIKDFKKEEAEANKFYGESDVGERKLDNLRDELERIEARREKEKPASGSKEEVEISAREKELRDKIKEAQAEWDKEKESGRQASTDYKRMETERNRQLQRVSDLKSKLDDLQKGIKTKGQAKNKKVDTPEIESLKKQVNDAETELNKTVATEKRINKLEDELQRLKERKEREPKEVEKKEITDREVELKGQIEEERKAFEKEVREQNKFAKEELDDDAKKLISIRKRNERAAKEIKDRITKGEFEKEVKKSIFDREDVKKNYPRLRKDALDAIAKKEEAQHEFDLALLEDERSRWGAIKKGADIFAKIIHTSKSIMAGIDDSATFVQNGLAMLANPKSGAKAWVEHWKDAFNDARFKRELSALHASPDWDVIKNSGLDITEPQSHAAGKVEEAFEKNLLAKIKIKGVEPWKYTGGIFERAFTSMGNNMRLNLFRKRMAMLLAEGKTFESHPDEYKGAARVINEMTGRGKLATPLETASPYITPFIWAPRMLSSTINTLGLSDLVLGWKGKGYYQNLTPAQRKFAIGQLGRGVGVGVAIMGAAALGGAKVDSDPYSVTFGDVIIGSHHYNVFGRFMPVVKTLIQAASGRRDSKSGHHDLDHPEYGGKTRLSVVGSFFRGKVTPAVGTAMNLIEGKDYFTQEEFGLKDVPKSMLMPMSVKELIEGWENDGTLTLLNRFLPAFEGIKTTDERDFNKNGGGGKSSESPSKSTKANKLSKTSK